MFFIGIFGVETKEKELNDIRNVVCKSCGSMSSYKFLKTYNQFHFFFIPIYKWGSKYYLISRCCRSTFEIPLELGKDLEDGRHVEIRDEDLISIYNHSNYDTSRNTICPSCRNYIEPSHRYCPYCGIKKE
jgi:ribosomal protein L32